MKTAGYCRVSTEEQAKEGFSIRAQEEKIRAYASVKDWLLVDMYIDEGISGKNVHERPGACRLIEDIKSGKVENVVVYKVDRLTRSTRDLLEFVDLFEKHHCAFNSISESIDTVSASGRMFLKIIGIFAEFERENLIERITLGFEKKASEGFTTSKGVSVYGYNRPYGTKVQTINEEEASIVEKNKEHEIMQLKNERRQIELKLREIRELFIANRIGTEEYNNMIALAYERREAIVLEIEQWESEEPAQVVFTPKEIVRSVKDNWLQLSDTEKRSFVVNFIDEIHIEITGWINRQKYTVNITDVKFKS